LASLSRQLQEVENTRGENIAPGDVELQANIKRIEAIMNAFGINYPTTDTDSDAQPYYKRSIKISASPRAAPLRSN
jgi:hypothetical protein